MLLYKISDKDFWDTELGKHLSKTCTPEQTSLDKMQVILAPLGLCYINNYNDRYNPNRNPNSRYATHYFLITYKPLFMLAKIRFGL